MMRSSVAATRALWPSWRAISRTSRRRGWRSFMSSRASIAMAATLFRFDLRHERANALGDGDAILIELVFPEHRVHQRAAELLLRCEGAAFGALMRANGFGLVDLGHGSPLSSSLTFNIKQHKQVRSASRGGW